MKHFLLDPLREINPPGGDRLRLVTLSVTPAPRRDETRHPCFVGVFYNWHASSAAGPLGGDEKRHVLF